MKYQRPKGTNDIIPGESEKWQFVEGVARQVFKKYRYQEIRTPIFENFEVFSRTSGETSDIVTKEMYDFYDKGQRHITLRPEGTAGVVRAYIENKLYGPEISKPCKVYYLGPMFRYERPQSGRLRQFHQIGVEAFGVDNPSLDVEVIAMALDLLHSFGLKKIKLALNTLGDQASRVAYHQALVDYLQPFADQLSADSQVRLQKNPLRVLDSKDSKDQEIIKQAPKITDYLTPAANRHFELVQEKLTALGINFELDPTMVRGLDYYNHTIFELMSDSQAFDGKWTTVCAGGRYNGLVEQLGGPEVPGIGFALGVERLLLVLAAEKINQRQPDDLDVYVVSIGAAADTVTLKLVQAIRQAKLTADRDYLQRKPKGQFKAAARSHAKYTLTIGEEELAKQTAKLKNMTDQTEQTIDLKQALADFSTIWQQIQAKKGADRK
jgi:histidyl-tRNA synthetase